MSKSVENNSPSSPESLLGQWVHQTIDRQGLRVKLKLRGNNLHILCQGNSCPDQIELFNRLIPALKETDLNALISAEHPQIYQIRLYGCKVGRDHPDWTASIYLNQLDRHHKQLCLWNEEMKSQKVRESRSDSPSPHPPIP
ncbi:MAG: hypothetical protein HC769_07905, partial [Cyanobacteria bacterium CRU_2_1]|nr:hypothetical protein [Cyanobacteria bacterium CRU_2_1]